MQSHAREKVLHFDFASVEKKHAEYTREKGSTLTSVQYQEIKNIELEDDIIDFYIPAGAVGELERYVESFGCTMTWRQYLQIDVNPYVDEKEKKPKRIPNVIGTLHFDLQSKQKLMLMDPYACQHFDKLAEICLFYKLMSLGIPTFVSKGWIVAKVKNSELQPYYYNIPLYIDKQVSANTQLQCVDVSTLKFYRDKYDKYFTRAPPAQNTKHYIEVVDPVVPPPPEKKQRVA